MHTFVLEPLDRHHAKALVEAAANDVELYRWSPVPQDEVAAIQYIERALSAKQAGTAVPFAIVRAIDGVVVGSTRFFDIERWLWPKDHSSFGRRSSGCLARSATPGSAALPFAPPRIPSFKDAAARSRLRSLESAACLPPHGCAQRTPARGHRTDEGGKFEGVLRSHRLAADYIARDSARYSIVASEWPAVKERLAQKLSRAG